MKKILILNHNQQYFGTWFRCFELGINLSNAGYKVQHICASDRNFDLFIKTRKINNNFYITTLPRIKYHKYFTGQLFRMICLLMYTLFAKYDICYAFTVAQPQIYWPSLISKLRGKFLIIDWDDLWSGGFSEKHNILIRWVLKIHETSLLKYADRITYTSEFLGFLLDRLKIYNHKKIPNGADINKFPLLDDQECKKYLKLKDDINYIVSIGNTYTTGLQSLIPALNLVPNSILVLIGQIDNDLISSFDVSNIIFTGRINQNLIPMWLGAASVVVLPMDDNNIEKARFPMRLGDYLCSGKPIVSNAVGEVKFYLKKYDCGYIVENNNSIEFARSINHAILNKIESRNKTLNSLCLANSILSWENITKDLISHINENY